MRPAAIGRNNSVVAQVLQGLQAGDRVILYPAAELADGARVSQREIPFSRSGAK